MGLESELQSLLDMAKKALAPGGDSKSLQGVVEDLSACHAQQSRRKLTQRDKRLSGEYGVHFFNVCYTNESTQTEEAERWWLPFLREEACKLVVLSFEDADMQHEDYEKLIKVCMRTATSFTDASVILEASNVSGESNSALDEDGDSSMKDMDSESTEHSMVLDLRAKGREYFQKAFMYFKLACEAFSHFDDRCPCTSFTLFTKSANASWKQGEHKSALEAYKSSMKYITNPKLFGEVLVLSKELYNKGTQFYNTDQLEQAYTWLTLSSEVSELALKSDTAERAEHERMLARTLRVMAQCLEKLNQLETALPIVKKSLVHSSNIQGLFLQLKFCVGLNMPKEAEEVALEALSHPDCTFEFGLSLCEFVGQQLPNLMFILMCYDKLQGRNPQTDSVQFHKFRVLVEHHQQTQAIEFLKTLQLNQLSAVTFNDILTVVWAMIYGFYEKKQYSDVCSWLEKCLFMLDPALSHNEGGMNRARACRSLSMAYFQDRKYDDAVRWIKEARLLDSPNESHSIYLNILILMHQDNESATELFLSSLRENRLTEAQLALVSSHAMETRVPRVAFAALMGMLEQPVETTSMPRLLVIKNAITIAEKLVQDIDTKSKQLQHDNIEMHGPSNTIAPASAAELDDMEHKLELCYKSARRYVEDHMQLSVQPIMSNSTANDAMTDDQDEPAPFIEIATLEWFAKMAFNAGLRNSERGSMARCQLLFEHACYLFDQCHHKEQAKLSLTLSIGSFLEMAWQSNDTDERRRIGEITMPLIERCKSYGKGQESVLALFELKSLLFRQLPATALVTHIQQISIGGYSTSRFMAKTASVCKELGAEEACEAALQLAMQKGLMEPQANLGNVIRYNRELLCIARSTATKMRYYGDMYTLLSDQHQQTIANQLKELYAEGNEGSWLLRDAWNTGVKCYKAKKFQEAKDCLNKSLFFHRQFFPAHMKAFKKMKDSYEFVKEEASRSIAAHKRHTQN